MKRRDDNDNSKGTVHWLIGGGSEDQKKGGNWRLWMKSMSGVAACLAFGLCKGPVAPLSRYVEDRGYTPYQILFLDDMLVFVVALCIAIYRRTNMMPRDWKQGLHLFFQGLTRFSSVFCLFTAFQFIPPATAEAVWNACLPVFVMTLSCVFLHEIPTHVTIIGNMCCAAGVVLMGYGSFTNLTSSGSADVSQGMALAISGALLFSSGDVGAKYLLESTPRAKVVTCTYGISTVLAGIGAFVKSSTWHLEPVTATVLVVSCCSHGLGILFFYIGLKLVEVNAVTALVQLSAFTAYGLQWVMLGFAPTLLDCLGLLSVLIGSFSIVIWEALARRKEQKHVSFMEDLEFIVSKPNENP